LLLAASLKAFANLPSFGVLVVNPPEVAALIDGDKVANLFRTAGGRLQYFDVQVRSQI